MEDGYWLLANMQIDLYKKINKNAESTDQDLRYKPGKKRQTDAWLTWQSDDINCQHSDIFWDIPVYSTMVQIFYNGWAQPAKAKQKLNSKWKLLLFDNQYTS